MKIKTLVQQWKEFESLSLRGASPIQIREMKKAFYAGAGAMLENAAALGDKVVNDSITEEVGAMYLTAYQKEIGTFFEGLEIKRRRNV